MSKSQDAFNTLKILHLSILAGQGLFITISVLISGNGFIPTVDESHHRMIQVVAVAASLVFLFLGFSFFRKKLAQVHSSLLTAERRMEQYRTACIIWWAVIEVPGMMAIIGFLLTLNYAFLFLGIFHTLLLFIFMPRKENIIALLKLNSDEVMQLEGKR